MQKARRRRPLIHRPPAPPSSQVLFLQTKLGELHATDLVALRRAHATLAQHAGALQCESSDADELLRQVLESPLLSPEWWADELAAASIVGGSAWLLARVVRLDALAPKARRRARAHLWPSLPAIPPPPPPPPPRPCLPARLLGGQRRLVTRRRRPPLSPANWQPLRVQVQRWANRGVWAGAAAVIVLRLARHLVSRAAAQRRMQRTARRRLELAWSRLLQRIDAMASLSHTPPRRPTPGAPKAPVAAAAAPAAPAPAGAVS